MNEIELESANKEVNGFLIKEIKRQTGTIDIEKAMNRYEMILEYNEEKDVCN